MPLTPNNTESDIDPLLRSRSVFDDDLSEHASNDGHDQLSEPEMNVYQAANFSQDPEGFWKEKTDAIDRKAQFLLL
ncbi:hypothetical protein VC83_00367 [Pseudogymnoascus destructans]|uniref:Uncharacterized protein n=1 Tax=Pseudogymnoascus destructans TaxID=655981 RepID=A0A177ANT2_9PEZI|nr:uncharacterized protein VC83_00367 [Pseudogymnoascus destructans]OAF62834.1 hypothetical protein VC83_00367 [Pseudogymnoascus destructans]